MNFSELRCVPLPTPPDPKLSAPGRALAAAMRSFSEFQLQIRAAAPRLRLHPVEVDALKVREKIAVMTRTPLLAIADDVDAGPLLVVEREPRRVVQRFVEGRSGEPPAPGYAVPVGGEPARREHSTGR